MIASLLMLAFPSSKVSRTGIEKAARDMGMVFPDEVKALYNK